MNDETIRWGDRRFGAPDTAAPRDTLLYRALLAICRFVAFCLGIRLELQGTENLPLDAQGRPAGGWIAAALPHRTWADPLVVAMLLPREPRLVFLADGRAMQRIPQRWIVPRIGGIIPVWRRAGHGAFEGHVEAVTGALRSGAVFTVFPEFGPPVPVDEARPVSPSLGYFALRSGAPIVPLVLGGTHELFLGRRIVLRVLPPRTWRELACAPSDAPTPEIGSPEEREAAHTIAERLHELTAPVVAELRVAVEPRPGAPKRARWLTNAFH